MQVIKTQTDSGGGLGGEIEKDLYIEVFQKMVVFFFGNCIELDGDFSEKKSVFKKSNKCKIVFCEVLLL